MGKWKTAAIAAFIAIALAFGVFRWYAGRQLDAAKQRVRDAGYPVTYGELDAFYTRPESGENRAYLLQFAFDSTVVANNILSEKLPIAGQAELSHRSDPIPEEQMQAMQTHVLQNLDALEAVFESFEYEECRFSIDMHAGPAMLLNHLSAMRTLGRTLSLASLMAAVNGDTEVATRQLIGILELADSFENEPILISQLVRVAIYGIGWSAAEQALNRADFTPEQLARLQERFAECERNRAFVNGLIGERCMWNAVESVGFNGNGFRGTSGFDVQDLWYSLVYRPSGFLDLDGARFFEIYEKMIEASALPIEEQLARSEAIEQEVERSTGFGSMTAMLLSAMPRSLDANIRNVTQARVAIVAVAAARYRAERGDYPDTAEALVPEYLDAVPIDPYGGAPLRYRRLDNGFVAYSIAHNLEDQNGEELEDINVFMEGDITFTVEREETTP